MRIDGIDFPPWGVGGGKQGGAGSCVINPGRNDEREVAPISDGTVIRRGDIVRIETGGGGGCGHPFDREPERVLADVRGGFVSAASAAADYGVVLTADLVVDDTATRRRRESRPPTGLFHRGAYRDALT